LHAGYLRLQTHTQSILTHTLPVLFEARLSPAFYDVGFLYTVVLFVLFPLYSHFTYGLGLIPRIDARNDFPPVGPLVAVLTDLQITVMALFFATSID